MFVFISYDTELCEFVKSNTFYSFTLKGKETVKQPYQNLLKSYYPKC